MNTIQKARALDWLLRQPDFLQALHTYFEPDDGPMPELLEEAERMHDEHYALSQVGPEPYRPPRPDGPPFTPTNILRALGAVGTFGDIASTPYDRDPLES